MAVGGYAAWGGFPWGASRSKVRPSEVQQFIEASTIRSGWMAQLKTATASSAITRYVSDVGYLTGATDNIPDQAWPARINQFQWRRSFLGSQIGGEGSVRSARIVIDNTDAEWRSYINTQAVDNREQDVFFGDPEWPSRQLILVFSGTGSGWERGRLDEAVIGLKGLDTVFDQPMQTNSYAGSGDQEGGDDLQGKPKVISLGGLIRNVPVPRLTNLNVYDVHNDVDGNPAQIEAIDAVFDRGVSLDRADSGDGSGDFATYTDLKNATTGAQGSGADIEAGEFATCLAEGYLRLGSDPDGQITADIKGGHFFGAYQSLPGELAKVVTQNYAGLSGSQTDQSLFDQLDSGVPHALGRWIGPEGASRRQVMNEIARSTFGFWGNNAQGVVEIAQITKPGGASTGERTFDENNLQSVTRERKPADADPAVDQITVGYKQSVRVQTSDLDANITDSRRDFIQQPWRTVKDTIDPSPYTQAKQIRVNTLHTTESGANALLSTMKAFYNPVPQFYRIVTDHRAIDLGLNRLVTVTDPEAGLSENVLAIGAMNVSTARDGGARVELTCYGVVNTDDITTEDYEPVTNESDERVEA